MKSALLLFFLVLIPRLGQAELQPLRCAKILDMHFLKLAEQAQDHYLEIINLNKKRDREKIAKQVPLLLKQGIEIADAQGIAWKFTNQRKNAIRILPIKNGVFLNEFAFSLQNKMGGAQILFSPKELIELETIAYLPTSHQILINIDILSRGYAVPGLIHEQTHAYTKFTFRNNQVDEWNGHIEFNSKHAQFNKTYEDTIYLDELLTYSIENHLLTNLWLKSLEPLDKKDKSDLHENIKAGKSLSGWMARTLRRQLSALRDPEQLKNNQVSFFVTALNDQVAGEKIKITQVQIHKGKFITFLNSTAPKESKTKQEWIAQSIARMETTATKAERIRALYEDLEIAVQNQDILLAHIITGEMQNIAKEISE